jgi:protein SCO1/2
MPAIAAVEHEFRQTQVASAFDNDMSISLEPCMNARSQKRRFLRRSALLPLLALVLSWVTLMSGCKSAQDNLPQGVSAAYGDSDCLPDLTLTDQHGRAVSLVSLKGKPALVDFIYTSCPGPCLVITNRMAKVAEQLGTQLGTKVTLVSITVDPEHDGPQQLLYYARQMRAEKPGWLFLTGTPAQIDRVLKGFKLARQRESDGSIDHILDFFLIGPDGREKLIMDPNDVSAETVAAHLTQASQQG